MNGEGVSVHNYKIQTCGIGDYPSVRKIIDQSENLDSHTDYTYWVALNFWPELFLVATDGESIVGFTFGLRSKENPDRIFLWQVGVLSSARQKGIATSLVKELCNRGIQNGVRELWVTIADENTASLALFKKMAAGFGSIMIEKGITGDLGGRLYAERVYAIELP